MPDFDLLDDIVVPPSTMRTTIAGIQPVTQVTLVDPTRQDIVVIPFSAADLEQLGFLMQLSPEIAIAELLRQALAADATASIQSIMDRAAMNGHRGAYKHVCAGCGREFDSNRRQLPGRKSWCGKVECRKVAAAERARDYRDRKTKEQGR